MFSQRQRGPPDLAAFRNGSNVFLSGHSTRAAAIFPQLFPLADNLFHFSCATDDQMQLLNWLKHLAERVFLRYLGLLAADADSQIEIALATSRERLLDRAAAFEAKGAPEFDQIAKELRQAATKLAHNPASDAEQLATALEGNAHTLPSLPGTNVALPAPEKRRGRPPKKPHDITSPDTSSSD